MKTITVRDVELGSGKPKVIVPITGWTEDEILKTAETLGKMDIDAAEWRADHYEKYNNAAAVLEMLKKIRASLSGKVLMFTLRTLREGGKQEISDTDYAALSIAAAKSGNADIIDVEASCKAAEEIIKAAHEYGCYSVVSFHDFKATSAKEEIISRLKEMQDSGADMTKIAVMPNNVKDVLTLLEASAEFRERYADRPFITISMGALGAVSRIACELSGSSMTFGALGFGSAPGQLPAEQLVKAIDMLHNSK